MEKKEFLLKLGQNIKRIRKEKGINQAELARRCERDRQAIERIENGKVNTTAYILYQMAKAIDVPLKELMDV